jgi:DNA-binding Xre family transcriptional regulator
MATADKTVEIHDLNLLARFRDLPYKRVRPIRESIIARSGQSESTFDKVLRGRSTNMYVLLAMCEEFNCTMNDILNPTYKLTVPDAPVSEKPLTPKQNRGQ